MAGQIIKTKIIITSLFICNLGFSLVATNKQYLKTMFHNPIPMNVNLSKEVMLRLKSIGLSKNKISIIMQYLKQNKEISPNLLYKKRVINYNENKILNNFFFNPKINKIYTFDSNNESEQYNDEDIFYESGRNINLNKLKIERILTLSFISKQQANSIIQYKKIINKYTSIYELLIIPEIDRKIFIKLMPYLKKLKLNKKKLNNYIETRYKKTNKANTNYYLYNKIHIAPNDDIEINITVSKNDWQEGVYPGSLISEKLSWLNVYSQYSTGIYIKKDLYRLPIVAIGDYSLRFGQHLLFGVPYSHYLSKIDGSPIKKRDSGIHKYTNPNRLGALRGLAATISLSQFRITPFIYLNDYKLKNNRLLNNIANINIESMINLGSGIADNKKVSKLLIESGSGINLTYILKNSFKAGLTYAFTNYSKKISPQTKYANNPFKGDKLHLSSVYFDWNILNKLNLFSEVAVSFHKDLDNNNITGIGTVIGSIIDNNIITYSLLIRYLDNNFHSPHSSNVIDNRQNEIGLFNGLRFKLHHNLVISTYLDLFTKESDKNSINMKLNLKLNYNPSNDLLLLYLFTLTNKPYYDTYRRRIRNQLNLEYHINKYISFRLRYENVISKKESDNNKYYGNLFYSQFKINILKAFSIITRITVYSTDNISSAIYVVENRLPFWYNGVNAFFHSGTSYCLILKTTSRKVQAGIKLEIDKRKEKKQTKTNKKIFLQLIYKW